MWKRPYQLSATALIGDDVLVKIYSDRPHPKLYRLLKRKGLHVSALSWHTEWHPKRTMGLHGTGYPHFEPQFYTVYRVETCRHCPHSETDLFVKETYRIIDEINARFL